MSGEKSGRTFTRAITGTAFVHAPPDRVYAAVVDPREQLRWNSLYLEASLTEPGPVTTGSVMTGRFKGSGRSVVTFDDVRPGERFTHRSSLHLGPVDLGHFQHTFIVQMASGGTDLTQQIRFHPVGLGNLVAPLLRRAFRARLPASFRELELYLTAPHDR